MADFKCPHCKNGIRVKPEHAGKVVKCAGCGGTLKIPIPEAERPIEADSTSTDLGPSPASGKRHVITEQTAKRYKSMQLVGILVVLVCVTMLFILFGLAMSESNSEPSPLSGLTCLGISAGMILYLVGRALAWWHHG